MRALRLAVDRTEFIAGFATLLAALSWLPIAAAELQPVERNYQTAPPSPQNQTACRRRKEK